MHKKNRVARFNCALFGDICIIIHNISLFNRLRWNIWYGLSLRPRLLRLTKHPVAIVKNLIINNITRQNLFSALFSILVSFWKKKKKWYPKSYLMTLECILKRNVVDDAFVCFGYHLFITLFKVSLSKSVSNLTHLMWQHAPLKGVICIQNLCYNEILVIPSF